FLGKFATLRRVHTYSLTSHIGRSLFVSTYEKEKRKNDERRSFPWWLLVVGFVLGAATLLIVTQTSSQPMNNVPLSNYSQEEIQLTATAIADQFISLEANGIQDVDALAATATVIILQATQNQVMTALPPSP